MTITTNTTDRKALAKAIAEELGTQSKYMGPPTFGYQIGDYMLDKEGNLHGDDFEALRSFLQRNGMMPEDEVPEADANSEATEPEAESVDKMDISVPAGDCTVTQLKNLTYMLYSRQILIGRMVQRDTVCIPDSLIEALKSKSPASPEEFTSMLDDSKADWLEGFDFRDGRVSITFPFSEAEPERWTTYAGLLNRIFDAAKKATRVFPEKVVPEGQNEKYLAHTWLLRLGYSGAAMKAERNILL
ncbi:MAG: hypothetical protein IJV26_09210, partial [Lachnospiraceae bacterium]|nr:hypothetical protein [Lachnospiraceae bacterium]